VRELGLLLGIVGGLGMTLAYPYVGVLLWSWFALQQPHQEAYGFVQTAPLNLIIAVVTLGAWFLSRERKIPPSGFIFWMLVVFFAWITLNTFFAYNPDYSWTFWDRTWKTLLLGAVIAAMATTRIRVYALAWIIVISLFYYGVKGGIFTVLTGGNFHVQGPASSAIGDNNQLAVALLMTLPFANYLRSQIADKRIAGLLIAGILLTVIAVIGSYSRGALIGLLTLGFVTLLRARNRFAYLTVACPAIILIVLFMPEHFFDRMATISTASEDASFEGRVYAWRVAFLYAADHFPFGAGFYGPQLAVIFNHYFPDQVARAAHSIYFQVLGEQGFIGLSIYLAILVAAFLKCSRTISVTRRIPEQQWVHDLAIAIQASLVVFCVSGAALSIAYYDLFIIDLAMLLPLRKLIVVKEKSKHPAWRRSPAPVPT
jgi:probable O-glycosylation ligase (exosortase A-associated)